MSLRNMLFASRSSERPQADARRRRAIGVPAVVVGLAALVTGSALAAGSGTPYGTVTVPAPKADAQAGGRWGERNASAFADFNADGVDDVFVGAPFEDIGNGANKVTDQGRVFLLSGKDMGLGNTVVIRQFDSPVPQATAHFGFFISVLGDVSGDAQPDIAIGTDAQDVAGNIDQGKAWIFNGATGSVLSTLDNPFPQASARFGSRIGRAGDLTGDGRSEVIVGASNNDVPAGCGSVSPIPSDCRVNQGQAFIFNGSTGALFRTLDHPDPAPAPCTSGCGNFGLAVQGPGDSGTPGAVGSNEAGPLDGITDQLVDAGSTNKGRMYVFSGASGVLIRRIDNPDQANNGGFFGFQDAAPLSPGDVGSFGPNGAIGAKDGYAEFYGNGFFQTGPTGPDQGRAWVFDGKTGQVLYSLDDPTPEAGGQFGFSMAGTNFNNDSFPDLYIGQAPHHFPGASGSGGTYVFGGHKDGLLKALELPAVCIQPSTSTNLGPNLGWSVAAPGDLNGDGEPDYVAGAPFTDVGNNQDQGLEFAFLSNSLVTPTSCS